MSHSVEALISELLMLQENKSFWKTREMPKTKIKQNPPNQPSETQKDPKQTRKGTNNKLISTVHGNHLMTIFISIYNQYLYREFKSFP